MGVLYVKKEIKITPLMHGGHQENSLRAGTYNVPGIIGLGKAVSLLSGLAHQKSIDKLKIKR